MATRPLLLVKPYSYALFAYLNASTSKPSFLRPFSSPRRDTAYKVPQFCQKLKVSDVKDEQFDSLGNTLVLQGWVHTLRLQRTVTFLEINDGSCLSNMQCVLDSEFEGYNQVESGLVTMGASVWVQGVVVKSQGTKPKVELKLNKLVLVGNCDPSFPIQKKRVSREFLRTKSHLRARTNTFGAIIGYAPGLSQIVIHNEASQKFDASVYWSDIAGVDVIAMRGLRKVARVRNALA